MKKNDLYIIKIGTNSLVDKEGKIRSSLISEIFQATKKAQAKGGRVLIVTSGAAFVGRTILGDMKADKKIATSIGQPAVFAEYKRIALEAGIHTAELLLIQSYLAQRDLFLPLKQTLSDMFDLGVVPVVNENDVLVVGTDHAFDGNDSLAQALAVSLEAKKLIIVSDVEGLYDDNPATNPNAKLIPEVDDISDQFISYCSKTPTGTGTGGMLSKLKSIRICTAVGTEAVIVGGFTPGNIIKAFNGESVGTFFKARAREKAVTSRERWILAARSSTGSIAIDPGAIKALTEGASLLAVGVKKVYGSFNTKEVVEIVDMKNRGIAFGIVDVSYEEIDEMLRKKDTHKKLLVHANNLFFL